MTQAQAIAVNPKPAPRSLPRAVDIRRGGGWAIKPETDAAPDWNACLKRIRDMQDQAAFAALFRHFAPRIKSYLIRCGGSASQAEEATQEAMATVWRKAHLFDPAKASAATWIFRIARNKQLDAIRRQRRPEPEDLPWSVGESADPADEFVLTEAQDKLRKAVDALPEKQRVIVEQAFYGERSHTEIAEVTNLPLGTIKSRIRLALDRLRRDLDPEMR
jgi:RNA polymerase sigma factor (sigma-70 family)